MGARYWATHPTWPRADVVADVNVEGDNPNMPWSTTKYVTAYDADSSTLGAVFAGAARDLGHVSVRDPLPAAHLGTRSDAAAFSAAGIPAA